MQSVHWDDIRSRTVAHYERHGQAVPDALSEEQVRQAEGQFGVDFPEDYRQYLLCVSAGGRVRSLRFDGSRWDWEGARSAEHAKLHVPFPDQEVASAAIDLAWERQPKRADFASEADFQASHQLWQEAAYGLQADQTTGAVFLTDDGCGFSTLLVVSGPMRGTMWFDGRATCDRVSPLPNDDRQPATFAEWYVDWLTYEELLSTPEQRRAEAAVHRKIYERPIWQRWFA